MSDPSAHQLTVETWTLWSIGVVLVSGRLVSRSLQRGVRQLQIDDALIVVVMVAFTGLVITYNLLAKYGTNLLYPGQKAEDFTAEQILNAVYGSKIAFASEQCNLAIIWGTKACVLILYHRLTLANPASRLGVELLAIFCALSYLTIEVCLFAVWCRPISQYWAFPVQNLQCATYTHHLILSASLNISSDIVMISIGLSLIITLHIPFRKKLLLCAIFSLGIFAVSAAAVSFSFFINNPYNVEWPLWTVRACGAAIYVANLPYWWALIRKVFGLHTFMDKGTGGSNYGNVGESSLHAQNRVGGDCDC